jgi:hypothetical protein
MKQTTTGGQEMQEYSLDIRTDSGWIRHELNADSVEEATAIGYTIYPHAHIISAAAIIELYF